MHGTPPEITTQIIDFCKIVKPNSAPQFIEVKPYPDCREQHCINNVSNVLDNRLLSGKATNGWVIWQKDNMYLEAEAHCVVDSEEYGIIDVTPHIPEEECILFIEDSDVAFEGKIVNNKYYPLTDSPLVKEYVELWEERGSIDEKVRCAEMSLEEATKRLEWIIQRGKFLEESFGKRAGRNDPCPCGSEIKYKKCCGKYR